MGAAGPVGSAIPRTWPGTRLQRRDRVAFAIEAILLLLGVAYLAWALWPVPAPPVIRPLDNDYLTVKARELGFDPAKIIDFVDHSVAGDDYAGVLRGPLGTLWANAGDDDDRALLLHALLDKAGTSNRLVMASSLGVEADLGSGLAWVGPTSSPQPGATPITAVPDALNHHLALALTTTSDAGPATEQLATYPTADLVNADLSLTYRSSGAQTVAVLTGPAGDVTSTADAGHASSQSVTFTESGPGASPIVVTRELFTGGIPDFASTFDASNRYTIVVSSGWIPENARSRESDLTAVSGDARARAAHAVAYEFLGLSDREAQALMPASGIQATVRTPRITIVADETAGSAGRTMSLDLRADALGVSPAGSAARTFTTVRSLYDASLEAPVLARTLRVTATSSATTLAAALAGRIATAAARTSTLADALRRLLAADQVDGSALTVAVAGRPQFNLQYVRAQDHLVVTGSDAVRAGLIGGPGAGLLSPPEVSDPDVAAATAELALVLAAHAPLDFHELISYVPGRPPHFYDGSRLLFYGATLSYEISATRPDNGFSFAITNHFDINGNPIDPPETSTITVSSDDAAHSHTFTTYYQIGGDDTAGRTWGVFSRDVFNELQTPAGALVNVLDSSGNGTPVRLWAVATQQLQLLINGSLVAVPALEVAGDLDAGNPTKPVTSDAVPDRLDDHGNVINKHIVLADPEFPYTIDGSAVQVQSTVTGRVLDAATAQGINGASVTLAGVSSATWPDGTFALPTITQPYATFTATIAAPGYDDASVDVDLTQPDAFPLSFSLKRAAPAAPSWALIAPGADSVLSTLGLNARESAILTDVVHAPAALEAAVPQGPLQAALGSAMTWVELDTGSGAAWVRSDDGLFGGSAGAPSNSSLGAIAGFSSSLACAYLTAASVLEAEVAEPISGGSGGSPGGSSGGASGTGSPVASGGAPSATPPESLVDSDSPKAVLDTVLTLATGLEQVPGSATDPVLGTVADTVRFIVQLDNSASGQSGTGGATGGASTGGASGFSGSGTGCSVNPGGAIQTVPPPPAPVVTPPPPPPSRPPLWPILADPIFIGLVERERRRKDPCAEARKKADEAAAEARRLRAAAVAATAAWQRTRAELARANDALAAEGADDTYVEGTEGRLKGVRLTRRALRMQRDEEAAIRARRARGEITEQEAQDQLAQWADPAYVEKLAAAAAAAEKTDTGKLKADQATAQAQEADARGKADQAERAAADAEAAARQAALDAAAACATPEPKTPGCDADGFQQRFDDIKKGFEDLQDELCQEFSCGAGAILDFEGQYSTELSWALRNLDAYIATYKALLPDLEDLWQAFRDQAGAMAVASYFDRVTEALGYLDGAMALGTLARAGIARGLAKGVEAVAEGSEPVLVREGASLATKLAEADAAAARAAAATATKATGGAVAGATKIVVEEFGEKSIYLLGSDASLLAKAKLVKQIPGFTDVFIHGTRDGKFVIKEMVHGVEVPITYTAEELAQLIKAGGYKGGPIRLMSCNSGGSVANGVLTRGAAETLAKLLKTNVIAPTEKLWLDAAGRHVVKASLRVRPRGAPTWGDNIAVGQNRPWAGYGCDGQPPRLLPL